MTRPRQARKRRFRLAAIAVSVVAGTVGAVFLWPTAPNRTSPTRRASEPKPVFHQPEGRQELLAQLAAARQSGDRSALATIHAKLSSDALGRARAVHDAWMTRLDPDTGLFPQSSNIHIWSYRNAAADFFCFQLGLALYTGAPSITALRQTLASERAFNPPPKLCLPIDLQKRATFAPSQPDPMFTTSEYLKDGLLGLYNRTGDQQVFDRIIELADSIVANSSQPSRFGPIPSRDSEVNGNVLQALSRLSFTAGKPEYSALVGRLGDAVVEQMLKESGGLPVVRFGYGGELATSQDEWRRSRVVQLRDHGNETAVGMSEAYALASTRSATDPEWADRADRWAEPLANMYELILTRGVGTDGLLMNRITVETFKVRDDRPCDNWGYLLSGAILFCEAAQRHGRVEPARLQAILDRVDRIAFAVAATDALPWEGAHHDGWADTIESAIYVAAHRPRLRATMMTWVDHQIGYMFGCQRPDGFVSGDYLDGNFIRTAMLYADWRSGGFRLDPFVPGCGVGFTTGDGEDPVVVVIAGPEGYTGRLIPDTERHHERMGLPWDWPRINSWPERTAATTAEARAGAPVTLGPNAARTMRLSELGVDLARHDE